MGEYMLLGTTLLKTALVTTVAAASFSFTPAQIQSGADYLNNLCGDTFCGGDFDYTVENISCEGTSCSIQTTVFSYYEDDNDTVSSIADLSEEERNSESLSVSADLGEGYNDYEEYSYPTFTATCKVEVKNSEDTDEEFYSAMVDSCVPSIESFVRNL